MKIYLAGPIKDRTDEDCNYWRDYITEAFQGTKFKCLNPMRRDYRDEDITVINEIIHLDKLDIRNSDIVLVFFDKPSVGTSMEVLYAWEHEKIVVVIADTPYKLSPWLLYHSTVVVEDLEEAIEWIMYCDA